MSTANFSPHADAREASRFGHPSLPRAGEHLRTVHSLVLCIGVDTGQKQIVVGRVRFTVRSRRSRVSWHFNPQANGAPAALWVAGFAEIRTSSTMTMGQRRLAAINAPCSVKTQGR